MKLTQLFIATALAASTVFANDHLTRIRDRAGRLGKEFQDDPGHAQEQAVQRGRRAGQGEGGDIESLKKLSAQFEEANLSMTTDKDWLQAKEAMLLIHLFHEKKSQMVGDRRKSHAGANRDAGPESCNPRLVSGRDIDPDVEDDGG